MTTDSKWIDYTTSTAWIEYVKAVDKAGRSLIEFGVSMGSLKHTHKEHRIKSQQRKGKKFRNKF